MNNTGSLYVVATPIGNLADITQRACDVLSNVACIAAEDTRHSGVLLRELGIRTPLISLHDHNESARISLITERLQQGDDIALISDAGTPLIADPGYKLVHALRELGLPVKTIPGPCALIAALSIAGQPTDAFIFDGFLPSKSGERTKHLQSLSTERRTLVFYESRHRIAGALNDIASVFGSERSMTLLKELTKHFEQTIIGTVEHVQAWLAAEPGRVKGEFVLAIHGDKSPVKKDDLPATAIETLQVLREELPLKQAVSLTSKLTGCSKNRIYAYALTME